MNFLMQKERKKETGRSLFFIKHTNNAIFSNFCELCRNFIVTENNSLGISLSSDTMEKLN